MVGWLAVRRGFTSVFIFGFSDTLYINGEDRGALAITFLLSARLIHGTCVTTCARI